MGSGVRRVALMHCSGLGEFLKGLLKVRVGYHV